jgi:hypothetical protein
LAEKVQRPHPPFGHPLRVRGILESEKVGVHLVAWIVVFLILSGLRPQTLSYIFVNRPQPPKGGFGLASSGKASFMFFLLGASGSWLKKFRDLTRPSGTLSQGEGFWRVRRWGCIWRYGLLFFLFFILFYRGFGPKP